MNENVLQDQLKVSVIIPCRNERGNIEPAVKRLPQLGTSTEIIFVEGHSQDGTLEEIKRVISIYPDKNISYFVQRGKGKADAIHTALPSATGDILMILDGDLTVQPEDLPLFYQAIVQKKGRFINGSRLQYSMESGAMGFFSFLANHFFARLLSWIIGQNITDSLCGTKVMLKEDYQKILSNRSFFGHFDPFGDFDLLFGAAKLGLSISEVPVHYKRRTYGSTQINRFFHGLLLLKMSWIGFKKLKLRI